MPDREDGDLVSGDVVVENVIADDEPARALDRQSLDVAAQFGKRRKMLERFGDSAPEVLCGLIAMPLQMAASVRKYVLACAETFTFIG